MSSNLHEFSTSHLFLLTSIIIPLTLIFFFFKFIFSVFLIKPVSGKFAPRSYPLIGSLFSILRNRHHFIEWTSDIINDRPTKTWTIHRPLGAGVRVITANPDVVRHILKTNFHLYPKGKPARSVASELLGGGIFNSDGDEWKLQRQLSVHEFSTKSLKNFVEHVVDTELNDRLLPILHTSATGGGVLDFQDILQRFAFDNICKISFGYDPAYLTPSLPNAMFAAVFEDAFMIIIGRLRSNLPLIWKLKRLLNLGSEKRLRETVTIIREFANKIIKEKKQQLEETKTCLDHSVDLLHRFLISGYSDETFVTDIVISFILAGRDSTSSALSWFFWLLHKNPRVEKEILKEINDDKKESSIFDEVKDMVYMHASLCESMRLYPPVAINGKQAATDDVLPDGTFVKKGCPVSYHIYAMGRSKAIWGSDVTEFRPERWLERDVVSTRWVFKPKDCYEYPVFQAGPRVCLGKEMAFLQMKRVAAGILRRFKVVPVMGDGVEPTYVAHFTSKMKNGFPVRIKKRQKFNL